MDNMLMQELNYATTREYLVVARTGAYAASTIAGSNTRKYHGLLVTPQPQLDDADHVLLASMDERVDGNDPVVAVFAADPVPRWEYRSGASVIVKELLMDETENRVYVRYTLKEGPASVVLQLRPYLAFRNMHTVGKANDQADLTASEVDGGIKTRLYQRYDDLFLQVSGESQFIQHGYWYYDAEYIVEQERGYESHEDLYSPGYFELTLSEGKPVVFSAGLTLKKPDAGIFQRLLSAQPVADTMKEKLFKAAKQFILQTNDGIVIRAGYYWFGSWGRDTCIALPGLTLLTGNIPAFTSVIDTMQAGLKDGLLSNRGIGEHAVYNTVDASLWFVWSLQYFAEHYSNRIKVWTTYKEALTNILTYYRQGTLYNIRMDDDGLISAGQEGYSLTWMDAVIGDHHVTPRRGKPVEINALWYNAVCFCVEAARSAGDDTFVKEWEQYPAKIAASFKALFWDKEHGYLADCIQGEEKDWSVRPNQVFAVSLPYTALTAEMQKGVIEKVKAELLTPRGLRTLSPIDARYTANYGGTQLERDHSYHQGTVWPWLLAHFTEGYLKTSGEAAVPFLKKLYEGMAATLEECCFNSVAEVFDGNYPYKAGGAVAQAWSVAELIRMEQLISDFRA